MFALGTSRVLAAVGVIIAALFLAACGGGDGDSSSSATAPPSSSTTATSETSTSEPSGESANIALFVALQANPFTETQITQAEETAGELGGSVTVFDANGNPQAQIQQCQDAVAAQKYNVFIIQAAGGPVMIPCARQAIEDGIKVISFNDPLGAEQTTKFQVPGQTASMLTLGTSVGEGLAELTEEACGSTDPCQVAYLFGSKVLTFSNNIKEGFLDSLNPNAEVVFEGESQFLPDVASQLTKSLLLKYPELRVITMDSDPASIGARQVVKESGKEVAVVSAGGSKQTIAALKAGEAFGTVAFYPRSLAKLAIETAVDAVEGKPIEQAEVNAPVDLAGPTGSNISKKNVGEFQPEW